MTLACRTRARSSGESTSPSRRGPGNPRVPVVVFEDGVVKVTAVAVTHGHAVSALAYRFDTADGSVVFSGDTTMNDDLIALAQNAVILVHHVADLGYLELHGTTGAELERMAALHTDVTEVGGVAERAGAHELILSHYLPADPQAIPEAEWAERAGLGFSGTTTAGRDGLRALPTERPPAAPPGIPRPAWSGSPAAPSCPHPAHRSRPGSGSHRPARH